MFANQLNTDRFFARIRSLDMACPSCGEVFYCNGISGAYRRLTGRFKCPKCSLVLAIAVLAYPVTTDTRHQQQPDDWVPTVREAAAMRHQNPGHLARRRRSPIGPRNVVLREGCRCVPKGTALIVHPQCPIHSAGAIGF